MRVGLALLALVIAMPVFGQGMKLTPEQEKYLSSWEMGT